MTSSVTALPPFTPEVGEGPPGTASWHCMALALDAIPAHVAVARREVAAHLGLWKLGHLEGNATLITSELATNAVRHSASAAMTVWLARLDGHIVIAVADDSPTAPAPASLDRAGEDQESGRGMFILQCLASAWGAERQPTGGKLVWATLPLKG